MVMTIRNRKRQRRGVAKVELLEAFLIGEQGQVSVEMPGPPPVMTNTVSMIL